MSRLIISLLVFLSPQLTVLWGQSYVARIDSILASPSDTSQVWLLSDLLSEGINGGDLISDSLFNEVLTITEASGDTLALALFYFNHSVYLLNTGKLDRGLPSAEEAIKYARASKDYDLLADANSAKLEFLTSMDQIELAISTALKLAKEYREAGNLYYESDTYQILSSLSANLGNHELAQQYDSSAIALARESEYIGILITALANAAENQNLFGNPTKSLKLAEEAVSLAEEYELPYTGGNALISRATANTALGNYQAAMSDYDRLVEWQGEQDFTWLSVNKGILLQRLGKTTEARELLYKTLQTIKATSKDPGELKKCYEALQTMDLNQQQYDSVAKYGRLMTEAQNALQLEKNNRSLLELKEQYRTLEKDSEIRLQQQKLSSQRVLIYAGAVGLLLFIAIGIRLFLISLRLSKKNTENEQLLADNETLIGEIHHRVKNNLQVVSSLLQLQASSLDTKDEKGRAALLESQGRVSAMSLIHNKLYQGNQVTTAYMPEYLEDLGDTLLDAYRQHENIDIFYDVSDIWLDVDVAISLGLIVNELITNSLKYAFPDGREGIIEVALHEESNGFLLQVSDDGVGAAAAEKHKDSTAYGTNLIYLLTKKLKGSLRIPGGSGYTVMVTFPRQ